MGWDGMGWMDGIDWEVSFLNGIERPSNLQNFLTLYVYPFYPHRRFFFHLFR